MSIFEEFINRNMAIQIPPSFGNETTIATEKTDKFKPQTQAVQNTQLINSTASVEDVTQYQEYERRRAISNLNLD